MYFRSDSLTYFVECICEYLLAIFNIAFVALRANKTQLKPETGFNSKRAHDSRLMADPDSFFSFLLYTPVVSLSWDT